MKLEELTLKDIQPSQFWVSEGKLAEIAGWFDPGDLSNFEPITIKLLDGVPMMTDGHTRAVAAVRAGLERVPLAWETDEWDWEMYRRCVRECRARGVESPYDLTGRVVSAADYKTLWNDWCDAMHARVESERRETILGAVRRCVARWDPCGLLAGGAPEDGFFHEADMVAARIRADNSVEEVARAIDEVFSERFSPEDFGLERCRSVAQWIMNDIQGKCTD